MSRPYLLVTGDFVKTGGMDVANHALARRLAARGDEVHLVAFRADPELAQLPNVHFTPVSKPANAYSLGAPILGARGAYEFARLRHSRAVVNGGNCLLPATNWVHYVHAAYRPHIAGRGVRALKSRAWRPIWVAAERAALRMAQMIIANSDVTRRHVVELCGVDSDRVRTVYYGVDRERFHPPTPATRRLALAALGWSDNRPRVAFIGGLGDRRKGFDIMFEAWERLRRANQAWDVQLVVVGTGAELPRWRARASAAGLDDHVLFLGFRSDVPSVLAACDALAAPTRYEAYGLGVHEALCCGLPAFVSSTSGIAERFPRALSDLLLPHDLPVSSLVEQLIAWRTNPERLRLLVHPFSEQLRSRSWDDMADELAALAQ